MSEEETTVPCEICGTEDYGSPCDACMIHVYGACPSCLNFHIIEGVQQCYLPDPPGRDEAMRRARRKR